jgi:hypothetical protein
MKPTTQLLALLAIVVFAWGCKKSSGSNATPSIPSNVYVAGYSFSNAIYWNNGIIYNLSAGTSSEAYSIFVSGSDIYVCGRYLDSFQVNHPIYWKNNVAVRFTDYIGLITDIKLGNGKVYASGYIKDSATGNDLPVYWTNGIITKLSTFSGSCNSIYLAGNDIYLGGHENGSATIWKNGNVIFKDSLSEITKITVSGNDVYATGYQPKNSTFPYVAVLWKNGVKNLFNGNATTLCYDVFVDSNNVYVTGYEGETTIHPRVWKNNIPIIFQTTDEGGAMASAIYNNTVYTVGKNSTSMSRPVIWANGNPYIISDIWGAFTSIFIK